jgi:hypothetical protein
MWYERARTSVQFTPRLQESSIGVTVKALIVEKE